MKLLRMGVLLSMVLTTAMLKAQNASVSSWEENMEQLAMDEEETNWEDELEELSHRLREPVNINTASKQQLEQFPFLTDIQIENILAYIYIRGQMQTLYELQLVEDMDKRTIDLLLPFVTVQPVPEKSNFPRLKTLLKHGKQEVLTRLDVPFYTRKGYEKSYLGPSMYHSLKYGYRYGDYLQMGITAEKDAGEPMFALHNTKGYDYYSVHFLLRNAGRLKTLALGNYRLSFGQGLVVSTDFRLGKTYSLSTVGNRTGGIRKHSSTDEYNYFRGAAATVEVLSSLQASAFYSHRSMDGVVEGGEITSIYKTGLHRTKKEADKVNAFTLQMTGANITYDKNNLKVGITGIYYFMNHSYQPELKTYSKYNLQGNNFYNAGIDYKYRLNRFTLTGEAALGKQGYALLNQLKYSLLTGYQLSIVHRYYSHDYWALFARSFGESSAPQNENGWYLAAEATPISHWRFFVSIDFFSFPWWKYRISKPSQGIDAMFQSVYSPARNLSMYINYRYKQKERDVAGTDGKVILPTYHHRLRYRLTYSPSSLQLRTTVDYNNFHSRGKEVNHGYQFTQSGTYAFSIPLKISLQGTYFHTDDYDSRVYASERGLLYTFYTPSFSGHGFRYSALVRYDISKFFMLLIKFGQTVYQDRNEIGSGNDLIKGNKKADMQIQLRMKF